MSKMVHFSQSITWWILPVLCVLLALPLTSEAVQQLPENWPDHQARVDTSGFALILGGGGARGIAHIGVIEVLEELGMRPSLIVGTSMGSVVGSLYASGMTSAELKELALSQNLQKMVVDMETPAAQLQGGWWGPAPHQLSLQLNQWPPLPGTGFLRGQSFESMVGENTADALFAAGCDFDLLPIPFRCLSTDLINNALIVHEKGFLARAVRASSSIPLIFYPVKLDGKVLVDGGMLDNIPVQVARRLGFSRAVIVDVSNVHLPDKDEPTDFSQLFIRVVELQTYFPNSYDVGDNDVVLTMPLESYRSMDMGKATEILSIGYNTASQYRDQLLALGLACGPVAMQSPPTSPPSRPITLKSVDVRGLKRMKPSRIQDRLQMHAGNSLDMDTAWQKVQWLAMEGCFQNIGLEFRPIGLDTADLVIHVQEEIRPLLELGANYITDDSPAILARLRFDNMFGRGGSNLLSCRYSARQSSLDALIDQPLNESGWISLRTQFRWQREKPGIYNQGVEEDRYVFRRTQLSFDLAVRTFDYGWSLYIGGEVGQSNSYLESRQTPGTGNQPLRTMHLILESHGRDLPVSRPTRGMRMEYTRSFAEKDNEQNWWRTDLGLVLPVDGLGKWTPVLAGGAVFSSADIPAIHQGRAGGPRGWVGLRRQEIISPQIVWSRMALQRMLGADLYVELAGSMGWNVRRTFANTRPLFGAGLEVGAKTLLGPLHLGYAVAESRPGYVYIQVGYEF